MKYTLGRLTYIQTRAFEFFLPALLLAQSFQWKEGFREGDGGGGSVEYADTDSGENTKRLVRGWTTGQGEVELSLRRLAGCLQ